MVVRAAGVVYKIFVSFQVENVRHVFHMHILDCECFVAVQEGCVLLVTR